MNNLNLTVIEGVIDTAPAYFDKQKKVKFTLVSSRQFGMDQKIDVFTVHIIHAKLADTAIRFLKKGSRVLITGQLHCDGENMYIEAHEAKYLDKPE